MCLAQGPQHSHADEARTRGPSVSSQALFHSATAVPHVDVRGECLSIFLITSCEIALQAHFSVDADTSMYVPNYNKWSAKIYSSYEYQTCSAKRWWFSIILRKYMF